jgi:hypothetical protein
VSRSKLRGNTKNVLFRPTDKKLWIFEVFRRSLGKAGMYWSQPVRVDHMCQKVRPRNILFYFCRMSLGHLAAGSGLVPGPVRLAL